MCRRWARTQDVAAHSTCPGRAATWATPTTWQLSSWRAPGLVLSAAPEGLPNRAGSGSCMWLAVYSSLASLGGWRHLRRCLLGHVCVTCFIAHYCDKANTHQWGRLLTPHHCAPQVIEPYIRDIAPDLIIVSAGFDAAEGDPLGGMRLSPACSVRWLLHVLMRHTCTLCHDKLCFFS